MKGVNWRFGCGTEQMWSAVPQAAAWPHQHALQHVTRGQRKDRSCGESGVNKWSWELGWSVCNGA